MYPFDPVIGRFPDRKRPFLYLNFITQFSQYNDKRICFILFYNRIMILLTGKPNTGKSTCIKTLIDLLGKQRCGGFYTEEILENGQRSGFRTRTLSGRDFVFAHVDFPKEYAVEEFGVDIKTFEEIALNELNDQTKEFLIIDEIASMQLYSKRFEQLLIRLSEENRKIAAAICEIDNDFTASLKQKYRDHLHILTEKNRNGMPFVLAEELNEDDELYLSKLRLSETYARQPERFHYEGGRIILNSTHGIRTITENCYGYHCTCDYYHDNGTCSHIMAVIRNRYKDHA